MENFTQMLKRAHIQQLRSFFTDGVDLGNWCEEEDNRPYEQRIREEEHPIWELLESATGKLNDALVVNQDVFLEIGIKAGANLMFELLRENLEAGRSHGKPNKEG